MKEEDRIDHEEGVRFDGEYKNGVTELDISGDSLGYRT